MGMKSRLFASAAFPLLSLSLIMPPAHSFAAVASVDQVRTAPQAVAGSFEVAQAAPSDEELLKKRHKQHDGGGEPQAPAGQEQPPQQEAPAEKPRGQRQPAAEQPQEQQAPVEKPRKQREPAPEAQPEQQQQAPVEKPRKQREPAPEAQPEQQQAPAEKPRHQREPAAEQQLQQLQQEAQPEQPRKKRQPAAEQAEPAAPQEQVAPGQEQQPAQSPEKPRRNKKQQPQQQEAAPQPQIEQVAPQQEQAKPQGEELQPPAKSKQPATEGAEQPVKPRKKPTAETQPQKPATEQATPQESPVAPKVPKPAEAPTAEKPPVPAQQPATEAKPGGEQPAQQQGNQAPAPQGGQQQPVQQQGEQVPAQPNAAPGGQPITGQAEQPIPAPEKVTPQELQRRKAIAADPSKSTETVVLPVENGAAVLDSDKDADRFGGIQSRRDRDRLRGQEQNFRVPKSDADAQIATGGAKAAPIKIEAVTSEEGRRLDRRPQFEQPQGALFGQRSDDNRVIIQINNQTIVRGDDDRRFLRDGERPIYEQLPRDRYRETIDRDGYQIVTIRNRYGDVIQRSRIDDRGREDVLYYSPDLYEDPDRGGYFEDPGRDLPPMRLAIPLDDYIIDTSSDEDRDYYQFLSEPPVEPVERVYSLDEVRYSARIRDKVRRIDLDTITFATGSAEIPMSQARTLRKVADAMNELLRKSPAETFLIEGHTDAVGSDQSNLVLSDQRAESVANVLTDVYGVPPENLTTQGYGERYLKVNTQGPNQENRRVTIRRVTALVRPVASR